MLQANAQILFQNVSTEDYGYYFEYDKKADFRGRTWHKIAEIADGGRIIVASWDGPRGGIIAVSADFIEEFKENIEKLPWTLDEIGHDLMGTTYFERT